MPGSSSSSESKMVVDTPGVGEVEGLEGTLWEVFCEKYITEGDAGC